MPLAFCYYTFRSNGAFAENWLCLEKFSKIADIGLRQKTARLSIADLQFTIEQTEKFCQIAI